MGAPIWKCECGFDNPLPEANKRYVKCARCGRKYLVRGYHVDDSPMLALISGPSPTKSRTIRISQENKARLLKIQRAENLSSISDALDWAILTTENVQQLKEGK